MSSVGEVLRGARLEHSLDLAEVSAQTKISVRYLQAIESDDRQSFPSGFFYKSFVDQYARLLDVDLTEIHAEVDRVLSADAPLPLPGYESVVARNVPRMRSTSRFPKNRAWASLAALVAVTVGCSAIYAWWRQAKSAPKSVAVISTTPEIARAPVASTPEPRPAAPVPTPVPDVPAQKPPEPPAAESADKVLLDLMAREATWLSVSSDGKRLFSGVLAANQTKTVEGKESATMKIGNAAGVEVRLNGKLLAPLGQRGQVLVVVFTPDRFQIVPPALREGD